MEIANTKYGFLFGGPTSRDGRKRFGKVFSDDDVLSALRESGGGSARDIIRDYSRWYNNKHFVSIKMSLVRLCEAGDAKYTRVQGQGRPKYVFEAVEKTA